MSVPESARSEPGSRTGSVVGGKYRLTRLIGEGGMGEVYEAEHTIVGRRFAVKFLHQHLGHHGDALLRFRREARAAGALENEHIASVVDFDTASDGAPFLVMEFLVGESVGQLLEREGPLPVSRAVSIVLQVCRGLEAAHSAGIIHRDLKPDNLFSTRRSDGSELVKILDFGIAKLLGDESSPGLTRSGAMMGTPFYMAPEQARGEKVFDERVDVYALGVILYELLSGRKPHPGDSHNSILAHILTESVEPLEKLRSGLPKGLAPLVTRTLSLSREERPSSVTALARSLAPFAGREVVKVQSQFDLRADIALQKTLPTPDTHSLSLPSVPLQKGGGPTQRRSRAWLLAASLLAGVLVVLWFTRQRVPDVSSVASISAPSEASVPPALPPVTAAITPPARSAPPAPSAPATASTSPAGRPGGRPASVPKSASRASKVVVDAPVESPKEPISKDKSALPEAAPRVHFDSANPYQ